MTAFKRAGWLVVAVILLVGAATVAVKGMRASALSLATLQPGADALVAIAALGATGWITFAGLQIVVSVSGVLPASALGIAAGSIYGLSIGFTLSAASFFAGAVVAFGLSRSVFRPWIQHLMRNRLHLRRVDAAIQRDGWRLACLVRLSPVMPFAATSYMLGLSSISLRDYCIGTLGSMPALFGYVAIGALVGAGVNAWTSAEGVIRYGLIIAGLVATGLATWRIKKLFTAIPGLPSEDPDMAETDAASATRSTPPS